MKNFKQLVVSTFMVSTTLLCLGKGGYAMQMGNYQAFIDGHGGSVTAKLYDSGMGKHWMICKLETNKFSKDPVSAWFLKTMAKRRDIISCKDDAASCWLEPKFQIRLSKAIDTKFKLFWNLMKNNGTPQGVDAFFVVNKSHKTRAQRSYVYVFYANDRELCYEKFLEIFGPEALTEFQKPFNMFAHLGL